MTGVEVQRLIAQRAGDPRAGLLPVVFTSVLDDGHVRPPADLIEIVDSITQTPQTWLDNKVYESDGGLGIDWDAPRALFPPGLLDSMFAAYVDLLQALAGSPAAWDATDRSLVPRGERELIGRVNDTSGPIPDDLLHEAIFAAADATPDAVAVIAGSGTLTFSALRQWAGVVAHELDAVVRPSEPLVAIVMEKSSEQIVAALAILETGRAFLPISADQPDARIRTILRQAGVRVALTSNGAEARHAWAEGVECLRVSTAAAAPPSRLPRRVGPDDVAYVIYVGSTGTPEGRDDYPRAARNTLVDDRPFSDHSCRPRALGLALAFDLRFSISSALLAAGGTVVVPPPRGHQHPIGWAEAVHRHGVTIWDSVPALAELVLAAAGPRAPALLGSLRLVMMSGDWIPVSLPDRIRAAVPDARLDSLGGATEASIWSIHYPIEHVDPAWVSIPYGTPLRNQTFHVLKADFTPCPVHTTGKLFIGGIGLAAGYWNDPDQTRARFVYHPVTSERLYDTGDLGRYRPDGTIEFLGREDHQVKIRGFRIELGEIEAALLAHPRVEHAVAVVQRHTGTQRLVAYVVPNAAVAEASVVDVDTLRATAAAALPDYMVPAAFVVIDSLPLTANGKLDRQALPLPEAAGDGCDHVAPTHPLDKMICDLVAGLLHAGRVGLTDNFFHLGGDSISAIRLVGLARDHGLHLTPQDVFLHPVVGDLARTTEIRDRPSAIRRASPAGPLVALDPADYERLAIHDVADVWPLTPVQEGLLFHAQYDRDGEDPYLVQLLFELEGPLSSSRLRGALDAILERHAALRVSFETTRLGQPIQLAHRRCPIPWQYHDLSGVGPEASETRAREIEREDRRARFMLQRAPLIRATLLRLAPDRHRLLLTQHHLLGDGWSGSVLVQDLLSCYRDRASALPPAPAFSAYLAWVQRQDKAAARDAWRRYLGGIDGSTRVAPPVAADAANQQAQYDARLSQDLTTALEQLARQLGLTLATVLQAAWAILLSRLTNRDDVVYGMVSSGRHAQVPGIERMLGLVITTTPVRARLTPTEPASAFMQRLQREQAALLPHHHLSLAEIHQLLEAEPLFDTLFTYQNYPVDRIEGARTADDLPLTAIHGHNSNHYPLSLAVLPGAQLGLRIHHNAALFSHADARQLAARLCGSLEQFARAPMTPLQRLDGLDADESRDLIEHANATGTALPPGTIVDVFERQVARTADRVAVVCGDESLTYAALDTRANQLAWWLIGAGVGHDDRVALYLERSAAQIVALLGTMKAGAAFAPLDTDIPAARLAQLLADLAPAGVLTTEALRDRLPAEVRDRAVCLDATDTMADLGTFPVSAPADADRRLPLGARHPAYVIYTSGSTGTPKGVVVTPGNQTWLRRRPLRVTADSRVFNWPRGRSTPRCPIAMALCTGATLVVLSRAIVRALA